MTINLASNKVIYQGDGATTTFSFSFSAPSTNSITVITVDQFGNQVTQSPGAYTVVLNPPAGTNPTPVGGTVTFPVAGSPLPVGSQIVIVRELTTTQTVSLTNQSIIYPPVIEQELDYLTMIDQQDEEVGNRAFTVSVVDPIPAPVPPVAMRANQSAFFDGNGNLVPGLPPVGGAIISAAMQPVVSALTLSQARIAMGIRATKTISTTYGISSADNGTFFNIIGAAFYTVSLGAATGFPSDFVCILVNNDNRGKTVSINGYASFILWPTQIVFISQNGTANGWVYAQPGRWRSPVVGVAFYVDYVNGNDSNDGLSTGTQAFKTLQQAVTTLENVCDGIFAIQLANGTHQVGSGVNCSKPILGAQGYSIVGNTSSPSSVVLSATSGGVLNVGNNASLNLVGVTLTNSNGACITCSSGGVISVSSVVFGSAPGGWHIYSVEGGIINVSGTYSVLSGANAAYHILCQAGSFISYAPTTVTFQGAVTFSYFILCQWESTIWSGASINFVNPTNVTAQKYYVAYNGGVYSASNTFPGNTAGTTLTGGQYA